MTTTSRRRGSTGRRALAVAAAGALAVGALGAVPAAAAPTKNLQVMTWNACDSRRPTWGCEDTGTSRQKVDVVKYHIATSGVRGVLLQEICEDSLALLLDELDSAWRATFRSYRWSQDGVLTDSPCGAEVDGNRIGTAIVIRAGLGDPRAYATTQPWTGLNRPFHCATATYWGVRLCNAHLTPKAGNPDHPEWEYADDQLAEIREIAHSFPNVVLGGDLNVNPPDWPGNTRAWLWPDGGLGYGECDDPLSRPTHDGGWKLDYIFTSESRRWCGLGNSLHSDHHVLIESVEVRL